MTRQWQKVYFLVTKLSWRAEQKGNPPSGTRVHYSLINDNGDLPASASPLLGHLGMRQILH